MFLDPSWSLNPPKLREAFKVAGGYNAEVHEDWLIARPSLPAPPWNHRMDRAALGRLLRTYASDELAQFLAWSEFAGESADTPDDWTMRQICSWAYRPSPTAGWEACRIYGCLNPEQKEALANSRAIPLGELPDGSRRALLTLATRNDGRYYQLFRQPTVEFGVGLPANGNVRVETTSRPYFVVRAKSGTQTVPGARGLAMALGQVAKNAPSVLNDAVIEEHAGVRTMLVADLLDPNGYIPLFTVDSIVDGRTFTWADAPPDVRQQVLAAPVGKG